MRKMIKAKGPPKANGKLVTRQSIPPLLFTVSLAASLADTEHDGYSAPIPNPVTPLKMMSIQSIPFTVSPCEAAHKMVPHTRKIVAMTIDCFLLSLSDKTPTIAWPKIVPTNEALETMVFMLSVYSFGYNLAKTVLAIDMTLFWYPSEINAKPAQTIVSTSANLLLLSLPFLSSAS